jgi:UDP-N-acetylmuramoyl-L-alanyl-D-glutamate--2,6-diaminopimelate ligase
MTFRELLKGVSALAVGGPEDLEIGGLAYSSKDVRPGDLFAALRGTKLDGFDFVRDAVGRGAVAVLSDRSCPEDVRAAWIQVFDPRETLASLAANFYGHPGEKMKVVGLTGTKGKTTTAYLLESIFKTAGFSTGVLGTINYRGPELVREAGRTTPEAPDLQKFLADLVGRGVTHCVMEVSSHALDLKRVWGVGFDVAVFLNLSGEHLDYHRTMEEYFEAKKKLFILNAKKRTAVVNEDDPWGQRLIAELPMSTITFGFGPAALVRAERFRTNGTGIEASVRFPGGQIVLTSPLAGKYNLSNILAAFAVALALNIPPQVAKDGVAALRGVPGRFEKVENALGLGVYVDYAHTDAALRSLLEMARELKPGRVILVFGAGGDRDRTKRPRMGEAAGQLADWTVLTSDNPRSEDPLAIIREIEQGFRRSNGRKYEIVPDRREAIARALAFAKKGDLVLIAGKGHESYQIIGSSALPFSDVEVAAEILASMGGR